MIDYLKKEFVAIGTSAKNKNELLEEIASLASSAGSAAKVGKAAIADALKERESLVSTGLEGGIAIPHCSFEELESFTVGLVVASKGINFASLDGYPARLIFFIVGPKAERNEHIRLLSAISRVTADKDLVKALLGAKDTDEVMHLLKGEQEEAPMEPSVSKCLFTVTIQEEDLFVDVLEILAGGSEGALAVIDADTAGTYLHKLPLFSSFWNDSGKGYCKIIQAAVDRRLMNETIRKIKLIAPEGGHGVLITVAELLFADGAIDF